MSDDLQRLGDLLVDVDAALALLPEEEQRAYREAQQSVVDARDEAQRLAPTLWVF